MKKILPNYKNVYETQANFSRARWSEAENRFSPEFFTILEFLDIYRLPHVAYWEREELPDRQGLYFVFDRLQNSSEGEYNEVLYIGRARSLRRRWQSHHIAKVIELNSPKSCPAWSCIAWRLVDDYETLRTLERRLIYCFQPTWNRQRNYRSQEIEEAFNTLGFSPKVSEFLSEAPDICQWIQSAVHEKFGQSISLTRHTPEHRTLSSVLKEYREG